MNIYEKWAQLLTRNVERFFDTIGSFLPGLLGAVLLLIVGWLLAKVLRSLILRLGTGLDRLTQTLGIADRLQWLRASWPVSKVAGGIVYWLVLLFFIVAAAESLGLPGVAHWITRGIGYLPNVFAAALIVLLGYALSGFLQDMLAGGGAALRSEQSVLLAKTINVLIMTVAVLVAADQLGVNVSLLASLVTITVAAAAGGLAFAFGMGAGTTVDNLIATRYLRKSYRVGDRVRIHDVEGVIIDITATCVILDSQSGRVQVPARLFSSEASTLLDRRADTDV